MRGGTPFAPFPTTQVSGPENILLIGDMTREQIRAAIWKIVGVKALGPDGFLSFFFRHYWAIICEEVVEVI